MFLSAPVEFLMPNAIPIANDKAERSDGRSSLYPDAVPCAATCKNSSAMLFVAAKVSQLALLPQGKIEAARRAKAMVAKMDELGFGNCTNTGRLVKWNVRKVFPSLI